jgi:hypothetical protein
MAPVKESLGLLLSQALLRCHVEGVIVCRRRYSAHIVSHGLLLHENPARCILYLCFSSLRLSILMGANERNFVTEQALLPASRNPADCDAADSSPLSVSNVWVPLHGQMKSSVTFSHFKIEKKKVYRDLTRNSDPDRACAV